MRHRLALALVFASPIFPSCSAGSPRTDRADRAHASSNPAAAGEERSGTPTSGPLTEAECMRLLDHYLELAVAEKRASLPPDQIPTAEQVQRIRTTLGVEAKASCIGRAERERYECALGAKTTRGVGLCLSAPKEEQSGRGARGQRHKRQQGDWQLATGNGMSRRPLPVAGLLSFRGPRNRVTKPPTTDARARRSHALLPLPGSPDSRAHPALDDGPACAHSPSL